MCQRRCINDIVDLVKNNVQVENYIRHEDTVKLLNKYLPVELKTSQQLYTFRPGDVMVIVSLKKPMRGVEVTDVKLEDLDLVLCVALEIRGFSHITHK